MVAFVLVGFPCIIWNIVHESKVSGKSTKGRSSRGGESSRENLEDETHIFKNKQYAPLIIRLALRVTMMAAGAAAAVTLTKKFPERNKSSNSAVKDKECQKRKQSVPKTANDKKAESVLPLSHDGVNDEYKKGRIEQKAEDKNKRDGTLAYKK